MPLMTLESHFFLTKISFDFIVEFRSMFHEVYLSVTQSGKTWRLPCK